MAVLQLLLTQCTTSHDKQVDEPSVQDIKPTEQKTTLQQDTISTTTRMDNPIFMHGASIGNLFNAYYKIGAYEELVSLTDSSTVNRYGRTKLQRLYNKLNYGYPMKLLNRSMEGNKQVLHYEVSIQATTIIKRLHVVIEQDTARIVPSNLERGELFQ